MHLIILFEVDIGSAAPLYVPALWSNFDAPFGRQIFKGIFVRDNGVGIEWPAHIPVFEHRSGRCPTEKFGNNKGGPGGYSFARRTIRGGGAGYTTWKEAVSNALESG